MRSTAILAALGLLVGGCIAPSRPASRSDEDAKAGYNRRELPSRPGVFTGRDGTWTIYRSDAPPPPPPPRRPTTLSCEKGHVCDPPDDGDAAAER